MRRFGLVLGSISVSAVLLLASCSSGDDEVGGVPVDGSRSDVEVDIDPAAAFCTRWASFAVLMNSADETSEELAAELIELEVGIESVLPVELDEAWRGVVDWNAAFIELFERVGYQPATEQLFLQAFDGDEERAAAAEEARGSGLATIETWVDARCGASTSDSAAFCASWAEFAVLIANEPAPTPELFGQLRALIDTVGLDAPDEIRAEWTAVTDFVERFDDLLVSVGYSVDRLTPEVLAQGFGSDDAFAIAETASDAGTVAIDRWSLTNCGDFCSRWPELRQALDQTGENLDWVRGDNGSARLERVVRALEVGGVLVPDELRDDWENVVAARIDWIAWWESFDFKGEQTVSPAADQRALELMMEASYLSESNWFEEVSGGSSDESEQLRRELRSWQAGSTGAPDWLVREYWRSGPAYRQGSTMERLEAWVGANCDKVTGLPGTIRVRWYPRIEGAAGDTVVMALMPVGASVEDLAAPTSILAGWCDSVDSDPWGRWLDEGGNENRRESQEFRDERWRDESLCDYDHGAVPARVDSGAYTLLAAVIEGGSGEPAVQPTLTACIALDVIIDGNTAIDLPELPPCEVDLGGRDDPWRNPPPVDPSTSGAGTLQIVFPVTPPEYSSARDAGVLIFVLSAGTTLNDVGREQAWPAGAISTWLPDARAVDPRWGPEFRIPVAGLPATGGPRVLDPHWLASNPPRDRLPLTLFAPGTYDVRVQVTEHSPEGQRSLCADFDVTIAGDTEVDLPELEECPSRL